MTIEVFYLQGCPNYLPAVERLRNVLQEQGLRNEVLEIKVPGELTARVLNFLESPTIRINGGDIEVDARNTSETGFACRRYSGGLPSEEMIRSALREARAGGEGLNA